VKALSICFDLLVGLIIDVIQAHREERKNVMVPF